LPNWKQVLENVVSLLKPQGWLWIDDIDLHFYDDGEGIGPSLKAQATNRTDPANQWMGQVAYTSARETLASSNSKWIAAGITSELKERIFQEAEDLVRKVYLEIHMTWSQKM
ncbi:hypothetical protein C0995_002376, partial [Termitomyces sp. Mi166